jgi:hypothetical protein
MNDKVDKLAILAYEQSDSDSGTTSSTTTTRIA